MIYVGKNRNSLYKKKWKRIERSNPKNYKNGVKKKEDLEPINSLCLDFKKDKNKVILIIFFLKIKYLW